MNPTEAADWPQGAEYDTRFMPTFADICNYILRRSTAPGDHYPRHQGRLRYVRVDPPAPVAPSSSQHFVVPNNVIITEEGEGEGERTAASVLGPIVSYESPSVRLLGEVMAGDGNPTPTEEQTTKVLAYQLENTTAVNPSSEALNWPSFHYLLYCDKSVVWSHFLNDLPLDCLTYRATNSLPCLIPEEATTKPEPPRKVRKRRNQHRSPQQQQHSDAESEGFSEGNYTYNVDALVVDCPSIVQSKDAYRKAAASSRLHDDSDRSSFAAATPPRRQRLRLGLGLGLDVVDRDRLKWWTRIVVLVLVYSIVFLVLCRLGVHVASAAARNCSVQVETVTSAVR